MAAYSAKLHEPSSNISLPAENSFCPAARAWYHLHIMKRLGGRSPAALEYQRQLAQETVEWYSLQRMNLRRLGEFLRPEQPLAPSTISQNLRDHERMSEGFIALLDARIPQLRGCLQRWLLKLAGAQDSIDAQVAANSEEAREVIDALLEQVRLMEQHLIRLRRNCT